MAKRARKILHAKTARKKVTHSSLTPKRVLVLIGKPLFLTLTALLLMLIVFFQIVGKTTRLLANALAQKIESLRKIKFPNYTLPKVEIPKFKLKKPEEAKKIKRFTFWKKVKKLNLFVKRDKRLAIGALTLVAISALAFWAIVLKDLPSPQELTTRTQEVSTKIYDRNGTLLYKIFRDQNRTPVSLAQVPEHVRAATLAAEDAEFYSHPGISVRGIMRSLYKNAQKGELAGGSTITQQLVKNALLSPEKTIIRKIREVILSIRVELAYTKDQIFEMYLNEVSYGGTAYGIHEASEIYFGKNQKDLTLAEAALLAGLPKSPTKFSPFGTDNALAKERQKEVLSLMEINGYITWQDREKAEKEELKFSENKTDIKAPHFVFYVRELLVEKFGEEVVEKGGLEVTTTLDYEVQEMAEDVLKKEVDKLARLRVGNGAALVINPQTGEILAMVGSSDYFNIKGDGQVNVTVAQRQPGSSIKPITYAYALSNGMTPASVLDDKPTVFNVAGQPPYIPKNYDGAFRGPITLRSALAESRNIPAVATIAKFGVEKVMEFGRKMGITSWIDPSRYGLSLTLGGGEVKLIDLATAYATIANYGQKPPQISILKVTNYKGKVLEENECIFTKDCSEKVLDSRVAFQLIDILRDNNARAPSFGRSSALVIPKHAEVAVKTGTSNDLKDNLTVGFNQRYLVAVWVGNNDSSPMARIASGVTGAAPIWNGIMRNLLASESNHSWEPPEKLVQIPICIYTGTLPCANCPTRLEWFLQESVPQRRCSADQIKKIEDEKKKKEGILPNEAAPTSN